MRHVMNYSWSQSDPTWIIRGQQTYIDKAYFAQILTLMLKGRICNFSVADYGPLTPM